MCMYNVQIFCVRVCVFANVCVPGGHLETTKEELQHSLTHQERDEPQLHKLVTFRQLIVNIWDVKNLFLLPKVCRSEMEMGRSCFRFVCPEYVYSIYNVQYFHPHDKEKRVYACVPCVYVRLIGTQVNLLLALYSAYAVHLRHLCIYKPL